MLSCLYFFVLMIRRPPRSTLFPTRRSSDLDRLGAEPGAENVPDHAPRAGGAAAIGLDRAGMIVRLGLEADCIFIIKRDRKSTRLNSSHSSISYAVFCLKKKKNKKT